MPSMRSNEVIQDLKAHGWEHAGTTGSHWHFRHPERPEKITVPHPKRGIPIGTLRSINRSAGLTPPWQR